MLEVTQVFCSAYHSNWSKGRKTGWVRIIVEKQAAILKWKFMALT